MIDFVQVAAFAGIPHGFFGRQGGVSAGDFSTLNVSRTVGDSPEAVEQNRARVTAPFGDRPLVTLRQTHSNRVVTVIGDAVPDAATEADALVTNRGDILLGVLTADCAPLLLHDPEAGVIGAAHAGWRGAVDGILTNTVVAMEALGARRDRMSLVIGPTISQKNYEVGEAFKEDVLTLDDKASFAFETPDGGKPHFDLPGFLAAESRRLGLEQTIDTALCTYADADRFFSHRRATHEAARTGRQIAVIGLA